MKTKGIIGMVIILCLFLLPACVQDNHEKGEIKEINANIGIELLIGNSYETESSNGIKEVIKFKNKKTIIDAWWEADEEGNYMLDSFKEYDYSFSGKDNILKLESGDDNFNWEIKDISSDGKSFVLDDIKYSLSDLDAAYGDEIETEAKTAPDKEPIEFVIDESYEVND